MSASAELRGVSSGLLPSAAVLCLLLACGSGGGGPAGGGANGDTNPVPAAADLAGQRLSGGHCSGTEKPLLTRLPMAPEDVAFILPYGLMVGGHVTPVDHQYFSPAVFDSAPGTYPVYAAADSYLHQITTRTHPGQGSYQSTTITDHRLVFSLSCRLFYYYDLVTELAPGLQEQLQASGGRLAVRSGQLIGRIGNQTLDFAVWDTEHPLTGFLVPAHYDREYWKLYTADPLDHFDGSVRAQALAKYIRTAPPISGRIDHDQDGRLVGNWFQANADGSTSGYAGSGQSDYWTTHLAFAPHFLDPSTFIISIGNWPLPSGASQFIAVEGGPEPAQVQASTGLVKYTLQAFELWAGGQRWNGMTPPPGPVLVRGLGDPRGCLLVQLLGPRELRAEVFPGQTAGSVPGFTAAALKYVR